jgi:hypothetical protein
MTEDNEQSRRVEPKAEPPEPAPGGPNAVPTVGGAGQTTTIGRDPDPAKNPETTDDQLPDETTEPDDTDTEATKVGEQQPSEDEPAG